MSESEPEWALVSESELALELVSESESESELELELATWCPAWFLALLAWHSDLRHCSPR